MVHLDAFAHTMTKTEHLQELATVANLCTNLGREEVPATVSTLQEIGDLLGVSKQAVSQLRKEAGGTFPSQHGKSWHTWELILFYHKRGLINDESAEKQRKLREEADKLALANARTRAEVVPVADVRAQVSLAAAEAETFLSQTRTSLSKPLALEEEPGGIIKQLEQRDRRLLETIAKAGETRE